MACIGEVKRSKRWLPSLDLMTNSTCLSICFCWISALTGSIMLRPCKISSSTPSRKTRSQLPGPPAAIPLMTTDFWAQQPFWAAGAEVLQAHTVLSFTAPSAFSAGVALPVTQFTKAGLKVELSPNILVPVQFSWMPEEIRLANRSLNSTMPPFFGWLEASTLMSFLSESVLEASAESTRLGPHSTNRRTPES